MDSLDLPSFIAGEPVETSKKLEVRYPYDGSLTGSVSMIGREELERAFQAALSKRVSLSRYHRYEILNKARALLAERKESFARLICREAGLCMRETHYEVGRAQDVLQFAAIEALHDDGEIFSCDVSPQGKQRKIFTLREPVLLVAAITPFNHPLNQVAHKVAPAIAAGAPMILKPSEKTPLTALRFTELLYDAGLPGEMLSTVVGSIEDVATPLITDPRSELVTFTGSVAIGKEIARSAGYKKTCLELGGNSPLIILADADIAEAVHLAAEGAFRNSGQRCTAVKRILVHEDIHDAFVDALAEKTAEYPCGDPEDPDTRVGTVIDEAAASTLKARIAGATAAGATVLCGGKQTGALLEPTVLRDVPRDAEMVVKESFGPLAPVLKISGLDDAIRYVNDSPFGLSSGIVTNDMTAALKAVREIRTGTVNVNEIPGFRIESSPFGGVKDSGLGIKEGVVEAARFMTNKKTFSLPWG